MPDLTASHERLRAPAPPPAPPPWPAVPAALFVGGPEPPFVLFDRRSRVAEPLAARTVYVSPGDFGALRAYVLQRLPALPGSSPAETEARAWALHRALLYEAAAVLQALPEQPGLLRQLVAVARLAADWVPAQPGPYLAELAHTEQSALTHGVATALYALTLGAAEEVQDRDARTALVLAGIFADASKLSLPPAMLRRPAALSPEEWALMRQHPERSAELLIRLGVRSKATLQAVRWHHEWWGGGGYPDGLHGRAIPLEARVVGIGDAYAALTVNRPHMAGMRGYEALMEMAQTSGQFEPRLLRAFVRTLGRALTTGARWSPPDEAESAPGQGAA